MENYEIGPKIGKGSFGSVFKVKRKSDGKTLVWKELNYGKMSEKEKQQLVTEVNILRELRHPHIVRYYDRIIDKSKAQIYIVMEYCEGGDLARMLKKSLKEKDHFHEDVIWKIFTQIVLALHECHRRKEGKIIHRDLKPSNIFLDGNLNVKLGDFGLARIMGETSEYAKTHVGTPYYMSPEQIEESRSNEKSDIWSAGCLLYEMAALHPPFKASNHLALAMKIKAGKTENIPSQYSAELQRVIRWMLALSHHERPSVEDLLNLPFVSQRLREKRLKDNITIIKKKEEDISKLDSSNEQKDKTIQSQEQGIEERKVSLKEQERQLEQMQKRIAEKEAKILAMELSISQSKPSTTTSSKSRTLTKVSSANRLITISSAKNSMSDSNTSSSSRSRQSSSKTSTTSSQSTNSLDETTITTTKPREVSSCNASFTRPSTSKPSKPKLTSTTSSSSTSALRRKYDSPRRPDSSNVKLATSIEASPVASTKRTTRKPGNNSLQNTPRGAKKGNLVAQRPSTVSNYMKKAIVVAGNDGAGGVGNKRVIRGTPKKSKFTENSPVKSLSRNRSLDGRALRSIENSSNDPRVNSKRLGQHSSSFKEISTEKSHLNHLLKKYDRENQPLGSLKGHRRHSFVK
mmetsp:Transcript_8341/g.9032  ORF Transcript_8341/g.9032 Transcript_8341/m.9032 type:complete len:630 (-) Transcript_8341:162-2051(-)